MLTNAPKGTKDMLPEQAYKWRYIENAFAEIAPHKICQFVYEVTDAFSTFYNSVKILSEEDTARKQSYIALISYTKEILEAAIDVLGFEAPERM